VAVREEVRRLAADDADREEMPVIREQLAGPVIVQADEFLNLSTTIVAPNIHEALDPRRSVP
jgi:hypothetical protein